MQRLKGKTCVVTGAARGIGFAICARFRSEGGHVILTDRDVAAGEDAACELDCRFERLDVAEEAEWHAFARRHPAIDVLVNNAGVTGFETGPRAHDPEHAALEDWRAVHRVNLDGTFLGCRYAVATMLAADESAYITGAEFTIDGGLLAGSAAAPG